MQDLFSRILATRRKRLFGSKPLFEPYAPATGIVNVEEQLGVSLPDSLKGWRLAAGYGDINEVLSFRSEWFQSIDRGELKGHMMFAQDILGNFYSFSPADGTICFICRSAPEFVCLAPSFGEFLEELARRDFQLEEWTNSLKVQRYDWSA